MLWMKRAACAAMVCAATTIAGAGAALADYGAIAFSSQTGAHGYSYNAGSRGQAERVALANCRSYGRGCRVVIYFRNACGALAVGAGYGSGYAWAPDRFSAERRALQECSVRTGGCQVIRWVCSG